MRLAEIDVNGVILNVIECDPSAVPDWAADYVDIGAAGGPGWTWDGTTVAPPPDPAPDRTAMRLSKRQVRLGLMAEGLIDPDEAVAWATTGVLPAAIETLVAALPALEQAQARVTLADFTEALRLDPMVPLLASVASPPLTDAQLDTFFTTYAQV